MNKETRLWHESLKFQRGLILHFFDKFTHKCVLKHKCIFVTRFIESNISQTKKCSSILVGGGLDLDLTLSNGKIFKLFDKKDNFPLFYCFVARIPHLQSNFFSFILYFYVVLAVAGISSSFYDYYSKANSLID